MHVLINSMVEILSRSIRKSNHHAVHFQYITISFVKKRMQNHIQDIKNRNEYIVAVSPPLD